MPNSPASIAVKICGITAADAADAAIAAGASYAGLVFHPRSPRALSLDAGKSLAVHMRGRIQSVALVADLDDAALDAIVKSVRPDFLQLHGAESPARVADIRARFALPVIKALGIAEPGDLDAVSDYHAADMLLFDAKPPKGAARSGGHGVAFDWAILAGRDFRKLWFLAGGLTPDTVTRAIEASGARAVDVSSGVESAPGVKSTARIAAFMDATRMTVRA